MPTDLNEYAPARAGGARDAVTGASEMSEQEVLIILDPHFGDQLQDAWPGRPVWITMSPVNEPVVKALWSLKPPHSNYLTGITGFKHVEGTAEDRLLAQLRAIDLHHGPYSSPTPHTALRVIGSRLTETIRDALIEFGFSTFQERPDGFVATRSEDEARRLDR
jgi:hypothetical protein